MLNIFKKKKDKEAFSFEVTEHVDGTCEGCGSNSFEALSDFDDSDATILICDKCDTVVTRYSKVIEATLLEIDSNYVN